MKIALASDLHLENYLARVKFGLPQAFVDNTEKADVLVLAGDIMDTSVFHHSKIEELFTELDNNYKNVIYVMGNHEHYCGDFAKTKERLSWLFANMANIHLLEKSAIDINGVRFFGGTMWTDIDKGNPQAEIVVQRGMNDYEYITNSDNLVSYRAINDEGKPTFKKRPSKLNYIDTMDDHKLFMEAFTADLAANPEKEYFAVTHHSPTRLIVPPRFVGHPLNPAYSSDLHEFIYAHPNIKNWVHGHMHQRNSVKIAECEVSVNARGYSSEFTLSDSFTLQFFDI